MQATLLLPIISAILLSSCVTYDPDYTREAAYIQDTEYPANKIVGLWMRVGMERMPPLLLELRVYDEFKPDGTGLCTTVSKVPAIYNKYKDVFNGNTNFSGEQTIESTFTWKYLGKNKWEKIGDGNDRIISQPSWIKATTLSPVKYKSIARYHNGKLFYPKVHSTAISCYNQADADAKLATIRSINEAGLRNSLEAKRARIRLEKSLQAPSYPQPQQVVPPGYYMSPYGLMPLQGNSQGYNSGYGGSQYYR